MSYTIDLATHGGELKRAYDAIVSSDPDVSWALFNYGQNNSLSLRAKGADDLAEFVEEFDDGKIQYGLARVMLDNLPKVVLVGWVGEGVPEHTKGFFNAHFSSVARYFPGYHVQITARSADDLSENIILQKVHDSAGSKYAGVRGRVPTKPSYKVAASGASEDDWGDAPPASQGEITKVASAYRPTKVDLHAIRAGKTDRPEPVRGSYEPVGKVDIAALRSQGKQSLNPKPEPLQSSYKPVGKVDIAAIRAQAKANPKFSESLESKPIKTPEPEPRSKPKAAPKPEEPEEPANVKDRISAFGGNYGSLRSSAHNDDEEEAPKSVRERMAAFSSANSGRMTELPKPKPSKTVSARFGAAAARPGTAPALPTDVYSAPKVSGGFKNYGSENGKTPAQLWAEKHGKAAPAPAAVEPPVNSAQNDQNEPEEEETDVSALRNKFAEASVEEPQASFSDLTSKFAQKASSSPSPAPEAPPTQERAVPPPPAAERAVPPPPVASEPIMLANPVARAKEPSPEPEVEPSRSEVPQAPALSSNPAVAAAQAQVAAAVGSTNEALPSAVALFDYEKDEENEIEFAENEIITEIDFVDDDWWYGTNSKGESGLFPASYVELKESASDAAPAAAAPAPAPVHAAEPAAPVTPETTEQPSAIAEYDYDADEEGEISFKEGEKITDLEFPDEDWWSGTNAKGESGLFPANYVSLQ